MQVFKTYPTNEVKTYKELEKYRKVCISVVLV